MVGRYIIIKGRSFMIINQYFSPPCTKRPQIMDERMLLADKHRIIEQGYFIQL